MPRKKTAKKKASKTTSKSRSRVKKRSSKKTTENSSKSSTTPKNQLIAQLGLELGQKIRFRLYDGQDWSAGKVHGDNKDGSLTLVEEKTGHLRAIMPDRIEIQKRGPRGGIKWTPLLRESSN